MPEAIATTKRKFYKALETISSSPASRPIAEPAAKRARRSISGSSTLSRHAQSTAGSIKKSDSTRKGPPNFSPWSHETFLARLKTFSSVSLWHPKPDAVSEVEWTKRGWICVDVNTVACKGGCERRVVVSLEPPKKADSAGEETEGDAYDDGDEDGSMFEEALVERYKALIVDGHADTCLWHKAGCKDDIYRLQVVRPSVWQPELKQRLQSLQPISDSIRDVKLNTIPHDTQNSLPPEKLVKDLPPETLGLSSGKQPSADDVKTLDIALHGWRGSSDSGSDLLHCDACFQRIGLWMYQPDYKSPVAASDNDDEEAEGPATIDLTEMHRDHCPWRNPVTQKASGTLAGQNTCQILQLIVATYAREQRRQSDAQQKDVLQPEAADDDEETRVPLSPAPSREEIVRQDNERESRIRKLKSLFTIKRKPTIKAPAAPKKTGK